MGNESSEELSIAQRLSLLHEVGEEVIEEEGQLKWLLGNRKHGEIIAYDGFEPSGRIHIAQGLLRAINTNKLTKAGCKFIFLVADWHAAANEKFGGDLDVIQKVGKYFIEVWKACGMDMENVEFRWASELVEDPKYWEMVLKISMSSTLNRVKRCTQIMGRDDNYSLKASQILYPLMQTADIFYLNADICQLGLDQRKVNMLAREVIDAVGKNHKPVAIHHHMLMGLGKPPSDELDEVDRKIKRKMSKSDPNSAIFMLDSKKDIEKKIRMAWCPEYQVDENPVLEYCKYIIFERFDKIEIKRPEKYGGDVTYGSYRELEAAFDNGSLGAIDLKNAVAQYLNDLLKPIRKYFEENEEAGKLLEFVKGLRK